MTKRLILSTNEVNRYGFRLLSSGARLEAYQKNPVLLFGHQWSQLPIGRLEDIKIQEDQITALPVFDESDDFGLACKRKWENNFLFAASVYFDPVTTSSDPELILPGQTSETVTEWNLLEVSMVTIPANSGAAAGQTLSYRTDKTISPITIPMEFKKIAQALGLNDGATEDAILQAIDGMKQQNAALAADRVNALMATGRANGIVTDLNEPAWRALAASDYNNTKTALATKPADPDPSPAPTAGQPAPGKTLLGMIQAGTPAGAPNERDGWTFDDWSKKDPKGLSAMRKDHPEKYRALAQQKLDATK